MYFSTFHIYGPNKGIQITEMQLPNPIHPYSLSHYVAELFVNQFRQNYKMETIILRLSKSFGAPKTPDVDRWTLVVNDLCYQAIKDQQLQLKTTGEQHRDFICMSDVCDAVNLLLNTPYNQLDNGLFNWVRGHLYQFCKCAN